MQIEKSPSGALFPYYYKNGELFGIHLGSYFSNTAGVIAMMKSEEDFIIKKHRRMGIWMDFYETKMTDRVIQELVGMLTHIVDQTAKLGIVGCSPITRWKIKRQIRKTSELSALPVRYFDDPEVAKTWLVSERE
jgi:hypothetical protein